MTPVCPNCQAEIPAARVNMAGGLAHCAQCNQMFSLGALAEGGVAAPVDVAKPADCDIQHVRDTDSLGFILPPAGWKRAGSILAFAVIWNCMVGFFVAIMVYKGEWMGLLFLSLFVAVGLVFALFTLYALCGTSSLLIDRQQVRLERKLFGRAWNKSRALADLERVDRRSAYQENGRDVWSVHLAFRKPGTPPRPAGGDDGALWQPARGGFFSGGLTLATKRTAEEHTWMISELRQFLFSLGHPAWKSDDDD